MANETLPAPHPSASTAVALFQRAHGRMTTLQRIDEQVTVLLEQRRRIQEELRTVQGMINEEFDRLTDTGVNTPNAALARISESARSNGNGHGHGLGHVEFPSARLTEEEAAAALEG